jgi:hypothetical protein
MNYLRMDLKVCEGCGALFLRTGALDGLYCRSCRTRLAEFPAARGRRAPLGPRKRRTRLETAAQDRNAGMVAGGAR